MLPPARRLALGLHLPLSLALAPRLRVSSIRRVSALLAVIVALGVFWAAPRHARATGLNVERLRLNPDDDGLHGGLSLGVDFQAGNVNLFDLNTSASVAWRRDAHLLFLIGNSKFATRTKAIDGGTLDGLFEDQARYINRANLHLRYNYDFLDWLTAEAFSQVERDEFLLVASRVLTGAGPRFVPLRRDNLSLAVGTAWMLEYEALDPQRVVSPLPAQTLVHRWSSYLTLMVVHDERVSFRSTTYVQPRFDRLADLRLMSEGELSVELFDPVSIQILAKLRWDTQPSTYCSGDVALDGCASADRVQLRELDVTIENNISVRF
ncbi:DUF481 domain-containing protein [Pseudenhygromyxa sp. WMMC2535]|uniref:DUF481 domain-containing protein n=1 Tax=Pseudenhygromyxa sp. WMMC2535 TaxID=2712867 RepID=UPI001554E48A|nr:DUF481 domain-containing protein [Pseudenhygromyxa sp. WMMC2535]